MSTIGIPGSGSFQRIDTKKLSQQELNDTKIHDTGSTNDNVLDISDPDKAMAELQGQDRSKIQFIKIRENEYLKIDLKNPKEIAALVDKLLNSRTELNTNFMADFQENTGIVIRNKTEVENQAGKGDESSIITALKSNDPALITSALNSLDPNNLPEEILKSPENMELLAKEIAKRLDNPDQSGKSDLCKILLKAGTPQCMEIFDKQLNSKNFKNKDELIDLLKFAKDNLPPAAFCEKCFNLIGASPELANDPALKQLLKGALQNSSLPEKIEILNKLSDLIGKTSGSDLNDIRTLGRVLKAEAGITPEKVMGAVASGEIKDIGKFAENYAKLLGPDEKNKFISQLLTNFDPNDKNMVAFTKSMLGGENLANFTDGLRFRGDQKVRDNLVKLYNSDLTDPNVSPAKKAEIFDSLKKIVIDDKLVSPEVRTTFLKSMANVISDPTNHKIKEQMVDGLNKAMGNNQSLLSSGTETEGFATVLALSKNPEDIKLAVEFRTAKAEAMTKELDSVIGNDAPKVLYDHLRELQAIKYGANLTDESRKLIDSQISDCQKSINSYLQKSGEKARVILDYIKDPEVAGTLALSDNSERKTALAHNIFDSVSKTYYDKEIAGMVADELVNPGKPVNSFISSIIYENPPVNTSDDSLGPSFAESKARIKMVNAVVKTPKEVAERADLISRAMAGVPADKLKNVREALKELKKDLDYVDKKMGGTTIDPKTGKTISGREFANGKMAIEGAKAAFAVMDLYANMNSDDKFTLDKMLKDGKDVNDIAKFLTKIMEAKGKVFDKNIAKSLAGTLEHASSAAKYASLGKGLSHIGLVLGLGVSLAEMNEAAKNGQRDKVVSNWVGSTGAALAIGGTALEGSIIGAPVGLGMQAAGGILMAGSMGYDLLFSPSDIERKAKELGYQLK
jgi:hypothetical protein